jgi:hypothetical protein
MKTFSLLFLVSSLAILGACGGATAERAKDDVKGAGSDLSQGVGTNGKGIEDGVGTNKADGGNTSDKADTK